MSEKLKELKAEAFDLRNELDKIDMAKIELAKKYNSDIMEINKISDEIKKAKEAPKVEEPKVEEPKK